MLCLQEVRLTEWGGKAWCSTMRMAGWHPVLGTSPELAVHINGVNEPSSTVPGGVAVASKGAASAKRGHGAETLFGSRALAVRVAIPASNIQVMIITVCGHAQEDPGKGTVIWGHA